MEVTNTIYGIVLTMDHMNYYYTVVLNLENYY